MDLSPDLPPAWDLCSSFAPAGLGFLVGSVGPGLIFLTVRFGYVTQFWCHVFIFIQLKYFLFSLVLTLFYLFLVLGMKPKGAFITELLFPIPFIFLF